MVTQWLIVGLTNAAIASGLAAAVWLGSRWRWNAHLAAVLWLIVLLKFVSPPLIVFSIGQPSAEGPALRPADQLPTNVNDDVGRRPSVLTSNTTSGTFHAEQGARPMEPPDAIERNTRPDQSASTSSVHERQASSQGSLLPIFAWWIGRPSLWISLWLGGAAATMTWLAVHGVRFQRLIRQRQFSHEDASLAETLKQVCRRLNISKPPQLRVVDARISPLLWTWWDGVTLVLPRPLIVSLTAQQQEMLLSHELAHLLRRDHLSRWLEAVVQSLYWWLPVVPWIRRRLHAAQEECCDGFVRRLFPRQTADYCDVLVAASTWIQNVPSSPVWASELGSTSGLKHRIQTMLEQKPSPPISRRMIAACIVLGMSVCLTSVRGVNAEPGAEAGQTSERSATPRDQPAAREHEGVQTEFVIADELGHPIESGMLHVRGRYDNGHFFSKDVAIEAGHATYHFNRPLLQELSVSITSTGYQSHSRDYEVDGVDRGFAVAASYTFQLKPGITIGGAVVDEAGRPLKNVYVYLNLPSSTREDGSRDYAKSSLQTDAEGKWSCPGIDPDLRELGVRLEHATHVDESSERPWPYYEPVKADEWEGLRALTDVRVMHEDPPLVGTIIDPAGNAIPDVTVDISGRDGDWAQHYARGMVIRTDKEGKFRLPRPPTGDQRLTVAHPDWQQQQIPVTLPLEKPLTVTLRKGKRIEFRAVDTQGNPIAGIRFAPDYAAADLPNGGRTDEEGRLVWENAPDQVLSYQILSDEYLCQLPGAEYGPDDSPVTLTFRKNLPVLGTVVDAETGEPIREFRLYQGTHFKSNRPDNWSWWMETSQTARPVKGSWAEGNVDGQPRMQKAPGRFQHKLQTLDRIIRFRVQADGYLPEVSESLDAAALPDEPVRLEFRLEKNTGLEHTVVSPTGEPAADARVVTQVRRGNDTPMLMMSNGITRDEPPEYAPTVEIRTDDKGRFELPIHNDPFVCVIIHESGYLELADRELIEQSELTLKPWTAIEGTVFAQGRPAPNVGLSLLFRSISMAFENEEVPHVRYSVSATTDQAGRYHIPFGMPGEWNVTVSHASSDDEGDEAPRWPVPSPPQSSRFTIDVPRQETLTLDIGREGVDVIGRVIVPEGAEIDWSFSGVHFLSEVTRDADGFPRAEKHQVLLSPDGTFRCVNLRPGNYEGAAIAGRPDAPVRFESIGIRKKSYEKSLELTPEMFVGKSTMNPIDIGDIVLEPVDQ